MFESVAIFTMHRGCARQLVQFLNYYLTSGCERIFVALDRLPREEFEALPSNKAVSYISYTEKDWLDRLPPTSQNVESRQVRAFLDAAMHAERDNFDYLAFIDADELLFLKRPFRDIVERAPKDKRAFRFRPLEMRFHSEDNLDEPFGATLGLQYIPSYKAHWFETIGYLSGVSRSGFFGHTQGKTVYKLPLITSDLTVHRPRDTASLQECDTNDGVLLHFDCGSFGTWRTKWLSRFENRTVATGLSSNRKIQAELIRRATMQGRHAMLDLYKSFFSYSDDTVASLQELGLVSRFNEIAAAVEGPLEVPEAIEEAFTPPSPSARSEGDRYQFAFVTDTGFAAATFASILSVVDRAPKDRELRFIILGDQLSEADLDRFSRLLRLGARVSVEVHDITSKLDRDVGRGDPKRATFGRVYLIDYVRTGRLIYLDGDILAARDLGEFLSMDLDGNCIAGTSDSAALRAAYDPGKLPREQSDRLHSITHGRVLEYINGGMLIMELDHPDYLKCALTMKALVVTNAGKLKQRDQDAMNIAFHGKKLLVDPNFNYMVQFFSSERCVAPALRDLKYRFADATLIHFSGKVKPWVERDDSYYNGLYRHMVSELEEALGLSCEFYFSSYQHPKTRDFDKSTWRRVLKGLIRS